MPETGYKNNMRSSKNRSRSKSNRNHNNNRSNVNIVNRVFDSSGPEGKVRGTPQQIIEKYTQLARDAQLSNDRVATENFQQHAEHYTRLLGAAMREQETRREQQEAQHRERQQNRDDNRTDNTPNEGQSQPNEGSEQPQQQQPQPRHSQPPRHARGQSSAPAEGAEQPDVFGVDVPAETGLVDTPESKPEKKPARKPRAPRAPRKKPVAKDAPDTPEGSTPSEAAE